MRPSLAILLLVSLHGGESYRAVEGFNTIQPISQEQTNWAFKRHAVRHQGEVKRVCEKVCF